MDDNLRYITHEYCKEVLVKAVMESASLQKKISFIEQVKLCRYVKNNMTYEEGVNLVFELGVRDYESRFGRLLKVGLAAIAGGFIASRYGVSKVAGFGLGALLGYMFKKVTDPCWQACRKELSGEKAICKYTCLIKGCNSIIRDIRNQIGKCDDTVNPLKCEKRLNKSLSTWQERKEKYIEKLELAKDKYAEKEAKKRLKDRERELKQRANEREVE